MKVAYIFSQPRSASYRLAQMILPQLEEGRHGVEVVGMFFFDDNLFIFRPGDPLGERVTRIAREKNILLMVCDQCALERGFAQREGEKIVSQKIISGVEIGCFPDLYQALSGNMPDQVITL